MAQNPKTEIDSFYSGFPDSLMKCRKLQHEYSISVEVIQTLLCVDYILLYLCYIHYRDIFNVT